MLQYALDNLPTSDKDRSELCLLELLKVLYGPVSDKYRVQAAGLILRYCAPFPTRGLNLTPDETIGWLENLASGAKGS